MPRTNQSRRSRNNNSPYKTRKGIKYIKEFPDEWINDELDDTGPKNCIECVCYGSYKGIMIGYCVGCAERHETQRGNGFEEIGREHPDHDEDSQSAWDTYLKDVDITTFYNPNWLSDYYTYLDKLHIYTSSTKLEYYHKHIINNNKYNGQLHPKKMNNGIPYIDDSEDDSEDESEDEDESESESED